MSRTMKNVPMCVVNIGFHCELLMPADKGMKLVALLQESLLVKTDYASSSRSKYIPGEVPEVNFTSVRADQIVMPMTVSTSRRPKGPLLLEQS